MDGSGGAGFLQILEQEGLVKALWICGTGLILFFFKEVYYAPTKFLTIISFTEWKKELGSDIKQNKEDLKEFIKEQKVVDEKNRNKQEERDTILYQSLNNRDNALREFIVTTLNQGDKK